MSESCSNTICPGSQYAMFFEDTSSLAADGKNCYCVCQGVLPQDFHTLCPADNKTLNSETCQCECISQENCGSNERPDGECGCECDIGASSNCPGNQVIVDPENDGNCQCGCIGDPKCEGDAKTLDPTTCECKCISQDPCSENEKPDGDCGCVCDVGNGDTCPENQVLISKGETGEKTCECGCPPGSQHCDGGQVLLQKGTAECECGCKEPQVWDDEESRCIVKNYNVTEGQTEFPIASDESYIGGTLNIKDDSGSDSYAITDIGSVIIDAPGATRNYVGATLGAQPFRASTQSDPHVRTFFNESYTL
jgi:hypothetical protein